MGDKRDSEANCGGGHPAVRFVFFLPEAVSVLDAPSPEFGVDVDERFPWPDDLGSGDLLVELVEPLLAPLGELCSVVQLSDGDEGDDPGAAFDKWLVGGGEGLSMRASRAPKMPVSITTGQRASRLMRC